MKMNGHFLNFTSGAIGSGATFLGMQPATEQLTQVTDTEQLKSSIVAIVGGLISTLLTNLLNKLLKKRKEKRDNSPQLR